jgi:aspartyl-tRNA(Asn)/glutamyl-tRNA(Gln) amidotransferase subunit A
MSRSIAPETAAFQSLADISELIRHRRVSPVELVKSCLERIERFQPRLNAFISVAGDAAVDAAKTAEREIQQGRWHGPLHGIPRGRTAPST